jgi:integrase
MGKTRRANDGLKKRCDCARKKWPKCPHPWHFNFHHDGRDHRFSLDVVAKARHERPPRTKADAETWRDRLKTEIRDGQAPVDAPAGGLTVGDVMDRYVAAPAVTRLRSVRQVHAALRLLRACEVPASGGRAVRFDATPIRDVTKADVEAIRAARRPSGVVGCNRLLARLRHFFGWAIAEGYADATPFKRAGVSVVKLETGAEAPRTRRPEPGEIDRILAHAGPHLRALVVAALFTGCRKGELLSLQWHQIRQDEQGASRWIDLPPAKTKTGKGRTIPIGPRLRAELVMRRHAPDGQPHPPSAYVFGNEVGERVTDVKKAWEVCVLKAHGIPPRWVKGKPGRMTPECRAHLRRIDLHFHDLRREFGCTLLESGSDLHHVRDFLGHADISTTSRYLATSPVRLAHALSRLDPEPDTVCTPFAHEADPADPAAETPADKLLN